MNLIPLIVGGILATFFLAALLLSARFTIARVILSILAIAFAAFCAFGFLASFEPSDSPSWPWQLAYATLGICSLFIPVLLLVKSGRPR
jgi:uncharacterized membrane protein HdeD (DUF308 family)